MARTVPALATAAAEAPDGPGVYYLLGEGDAGTELLYAGRAANLRRRLGRHAEGGVAGGSGALDRYRRVSRVVVEPLEDEHAAAVRQADVVVALRPPLNDLDPGEGRTWLVVRPVTAGAEPGAPEPVELVRLGHDADLAGERRGGRVYGCFPHLGSGLALRPSVACNEGYGALVRLLLSAGPGPGPDGEAGPGGVGAGAGAGAGLRAVPERLAMRLARPWQASLHELLSGRSNRLLRELAKAGRAPGRHVNPSLLRDLEAAQAFFLHGPQALRERAAAHNQPPGPMPPEVFEIVVASEVRALVGPFRVPAADPPAPSRAS